MVFYNTKKLCPVDTGNLRNSITHQIQESEGAVSHLLQDSGVMEIRKHLPKSTGEESPQEKKEKSGKKYADQTFVRVISAR